MKVFISPIATLLVAASIGGAAAEDESSPVGKVLATLMTISNSLENPESLSEGDWSSMLACTADMNSENPSLIDESNCGTAKDSDGAACVWCDASAVIGQGLCVSTSQKTMLGQFWDAVCAADDGSNVPDVPPTPPVPVPVAPVTPSPTPLPTPPPTDPAPVPDDDGIPDQLKCAMDGQDVVADETSCTAKKDTTSATDENCVWCKVPILGGSCITNSMHSSMSWICRSSSELFSGKEKEGGYLRGDNGDKGGFKQLDPSCLVEKDQCGNKTDSNGGACIWCDAGNNVFGICATSAQKDYLGRYLDCAAPATAAHAEQAPVAVE